MQTNENMKFRFGITQLPKAFNEKSIVLNFFSENESAIIYSPVEIFKKSFPSVNSSSASVETHLVLHQKYALHSNRLRFPYFEFEN